MLVDFGVIVMIMSGVEDGTLLQLKSDLDGSFREGHWKLSIGRRDDNDICLRNDTFVSRAHANIHWRDNTWWLEDCKSTNGSFIENEQDYFTDRRVHGIVPVEPGQMLRIGRTWMRIQVIE